MRRTTRLDRASRTVRVSQIFEWYAADFAPLTDQQRRDILEIVEDRYGARCTVITSQLPVEEWHDHLGDPTIADAVLDRVVHHAHRIKLKGPSGRKQERSET